MTSRSALRRLVCLLALLGAAADAQAASKLDPRLRMARAATPQRLRALSSTLAVRAGPQPAADVFVRLAPGVHRADLQRAYPAATFRTEAGGVVTANVPFSLLDAFEADPRVAHVQLGRKVFPSMDVVRSAAIQAANNYLGVLQSGGDLATLDGSGVVVGDVDTGIDWTHPDFVTSSNASRILSIWDQTVSGTPPSGYAYGTEWSQTQITNALRAVPGYSVSEQDTEGHGTHVAGIMASNGRGSSGTSYTGMASNADIVMVKTDFQDTSIVDGVNYIIAKAAAAGKRAVINLSLGSQSGPHDGTDSFDAPIGAIAASTPVFVAAGNDQDWLPHAHHTGGGNPSFEMDVSAANTTELDAEFWHPSGDGYSVTVTLVDGNGDAIAGSVTAASGVDTSGTINTDVNYSTDVATVYIYNATNTGHPSGDKQIFVEVDDPTLVTFAVRYQFTRTSSAGTGVIDGYAGGDGPGTGWSSATADRVSWGSVSEPGTAKNVFTVGAYITKTSWPDHNNQTECYSFDEQTCAPLTMGDIAPFSNTGPSRDGRQEPEVTAPGYGVVSSYSSASTFDATIVAPDGKHILNQGTSMATPVVAGWAALALQVYPNETVSQLRTLLQSKDTRSDSKVSLAGSVPNSTWGYGKLMVNLNFLTAATGMATAGVTTNSASWTWNAVSDATAYHVYNASATGNGVIATVTSPSFTWSGLASNTSVDIIVHPWNPAGEGPSTLATSQVTLSPAIGGSPSLTVYPSSVTVSFTPCSSGCSGYNLQVSTASNFSNATVVTTANTALSQLSATGLTGSTQYYARLGTVNSAGAVNFTSLGTFTTSAPYLQPGSAAFSNVGSSQIQVSWTSGGNPAGVNYVVQGSTNSGFSGAIVSAQGVDLFTKLFTALSPNTSYYFEVAAGPGSPILVEGPQATLAAAPASAGTASVDATDVTVSWQSAGNPSDTYYVAQLSTDSFAHVLASSQTLNLTATFSGLQPNTTYYSRVEALSRSGAASAYTTAVATATNVAVPASLSLISQGTASLSISWSANGNAAGTSYLAQAIDPGGGVAASSATKNAQATLSGLTPATQYFTRVEAIAANGTTSGFAAAGPFATDPAAPVSGSLADSSQTSLQASWSSGGNPSGTVYEVSLSTDNFATTNSAATTTSLSLTLSSLLSNTTYWARVRAEGYAGAFSAYASLGSGVTMASPPGSLAVSAAGSSSVSASWAANNAAGTTYGAELSADSFASVLATSVTLNTSATFSGLTANTTYYVRVQAFNWSGASTTYAASVTTATTPAPPVAAAVSGVAASAVTANWLTGGNAASTTRYAAQISTDNFASVNASAATTALFASFAGLLSNTTYWLRVRADGHDGQSSAYTSLGSTITLLQAPALAGSPVSAPSATSALAQWTSGGNGPGTSYLAQISANGFVSVLASSATYNLSALFGTGGQGAALSPNTSYALRVQASGATGNSSAFLSLGSVYTLANPPSGTTFSNVLASSASISWALNGNPAGTSAEVERSTDSVTYPSSAAVTGTSYTDATLLGCSTYYFRVRNRNGDGATTSFDSVVRFVTSNTIPSPPLGLEADPLAGGRIALSWTPSPTEGVTSYRLYSDLGTGAVSYAAPFAVLPSSATSYTSGILVSSAAYTFALRAVHRCGVEETTGVFASAASTSALAGVRAVIRTPDSGKKVKGNSVSIVADLASGTPDQVSQVTFQYWPPGGSGWVNVPAANVQHPNPDSDYPYVIQWDADADAHGPGSYQLRAVAVDLRGSSDTAPSASIISVVAGSDYDISESVRGDGKIQKDQVVNNAVSNTVVAGGATTGDPVVRVVVPSGAVGSSTVTVTLVSNPVIPSTTSPAGYALVGSALQVTLSNGMTSLNGTASLTLTYPESAALARDLQIQSYDPVSGAWSRIGSATVNTADRTVTASTPHFSLFAVVAGSAQGDLSGVRVYPIPYKPNVGDPNQGRPYSPSDQYSGIVFDRLPAEATIKIYTLSGRLVASLTETGSGGAVQWDARNGDGRDAASGGYFAVIASPGAKSVVKKIVILR